MEELVFACREMYGNQLLPFNLWSLKIILIFRVRPFRLNFQLFPWSFIVSLTQLPYNFSLGPLEFGFYYQPSILVLSLLSFDYFLKHSPFRLTIYPESRTFLNNYFKISMRPVITVLNFFDFSLSYKFRMDIKPRFIEFIFLRVEFYR